MTHTINHMSLYEYYREFEDSQIKYDGFQEGVRDVGFPLFTDLSTGSTIVVKVPCDACGMPTVNDVEVGTLIGEAVFEHRRNWALKQSQEVA